mgnify:CR=1 FL=1
MSFITQYWPRLLAHIRREGTSTYSLALSISLGVWGGTFPILLTSTLLILLFARPCCLFRNLTINNRTLEINQYLAQFTSLLALPLNLITLRLFLKYERG